MSTQKPRPGGRPPNRLALEDAAKLYVVYLHALRISNPKKQAYIRVVRHILTFYGYKFPLRNFNGKRVLQYADIYDPFDFDPYTRERGQVFWKFVHFLKRNEMIPAWTAPEPKGEND